MINSPYYRRKALKRRVHGRQSYREPRLLKRGRHVSAEDGLGADDANRLGGLVYDRPHRKHRTGVPVTVRTVDGQLQRTFAARHGRNKVVPRGSDPRLYSKTGFFCAINESRLLQACL